MIPLGTANQFGTDGSFLKLSPKGIGTLLRLRTSFRNITPLNAPIPLMGSRSPEYVGIPPRRDTSPWATSFGTGDRLSVGRPFERRMYLE